MKNIFISAVIALTASAQAQQLPPPIPTPRVGGYTPEVVQTFGGGIPLAEFLKITLEVGAKKSYVFLEKDGAQKLINANLKAVGSNPLPLVREILKRNGYEIKDVDGTLVIAEATKEEEQEKTEVAVYKPKFRGAGSIASYLNTIKDLKTSAGGGSVMRSPVAGGTDTQSAVNASGTQYAQTDTDPPYIVMRGTAQAIKEARELLNKIDIAVPEVLIRAHVFEVRDTERNETAISLVLNLLNGKLGAKIGAGIGDAITLNLPSVSAAITALQADSRVSVISSPLLRAADGKTAVAQIDADTPTLGAIVTTNGASQQSVTYQSAGVILSLTPRVLENAIHLSVSQELSSFAKTENGVNNSPTKVRRSFKSEVIAKDGELLLLGGLAENSSSNTNAGIFGFRTGKSRDSNKSELVVLIEAKRI